MKYNKYMPSRNVIKQQVPKSYYHVYARGINKQVLFEDDFDYNYFLELFSRYLSGKQAIGKTGLIYPNFKDKIELLAYCLMPNHFHLLIYQDDVPYLEKIMRSVMTSYSRYHNLKYKKTGTLFESRYKAVIIDNDSYLLHITRYIHLNPRSWIRYKYSSLMYYKGVISPVWLNTTKVLDLFNSNQEYMNFLVNFDDYDSVQDIIDYNIDG